jgi:hypothetical protein
VQLGQKGFEIHPTVKRGYVLWRFVTPLTLRCVKCLAPLLRPAELAKHSTNETTARRRITIANLFL